MWIGLAATQNNESTSTKYCLPGSAANTISMKIDAGSSHAEINQNGFSLFDSDEEIVFSGLRPLNIGDFVGCGFCPVQKYVFFTLNGERISPKVKLV